jgi:hypothetical protein
MYNTWGALRFFTDVVKLGEALGEAQPMRPKRGASKKTPPNTAQVRATISFPPALYKSLEDIARQKKVSLAWVVREASESYAADHKPASGKP